MNDTKKPLLVGEHNPYGSDPYYALYPAPDGCSGHRLCHLILGMYAHDYLEAFERVDLCASRWSLREARSKALALSERHEKIILLGSKVCSAFSMPFAPFETAANGAALAPPHPSGLCRIWHQPGAFTRARDVVTAFAPELRPLLGRAS